MLRKINADPNNNNFAKIYDKSSGHIRGLIEVTENEIIIAFLGTKTIDDILYDSRFYQSNIINKNIYVHNGFHKSYKNIKDNVFLNLNNIVKDIDTTNYDLIITGHSLGSSQALLLASDLLNYGKFKKRSILIFSSPKIGNSKYVDYVKNVLCKKFQYMHILNKKDIIPNLPPKILGYKKIPFNNYYIKSKHTHSIYKN